VLPGYEVVSRSGEAALRRGRARTPPRPWWPFSNEPVDEETVLLLCLDPRGPRAIAPRPPPLRVPRVARRRPQAPARPHLSPGLGPFYRRFAPTSAGRRDNRGAPSGRPTTSRDVPVMVVGLPCHGPRPGLPGPSAPPATTGRSSRPLEKHAPRRATRDGASGPRSRRCRSGRLWQGPAHARPPALGHGRRRRPDGLGPRRPERPPGADRPDPGPGAPTTAGAPASRAPTRRPSRPIGRG